MASFHRVLSFHDGPNKYLVGLKKGSKVYVEAGFEIREPEPGADATTPQGQRQIFLRHGLSQIYALDTGIDISGTLESIRVLNRPKPTESVDEE